MKITKKFVAILSVLLFGFVATGILIAKNKSNKGDCNLKKCSYSDIKSCGGDKSEDAEKAKEEDLEEDVEEDNKEKADV